MVHVTDFELDSDMMELLGSFESRLESAKMQVNVKSNFLAFKEANNWSSKDKIMGRCRG